MKEKTKFWLLIRLFISNLLFWYISGHELDPFMLFRIIEVLHSTYKAGHIQISDFISFLITLASRFKVFPGKFRMISPLASNFGSIVYVVCVWQGDSCLQKIFFLPRREIRRPQIVQLLNHWSVLFAHACRRWVTIL